MSLHNTIDTLKKGSPERDSLFTVLSYQSSSSLSDWRTVPLTASIS